MGTLDTYGFDVNDIIDRFGGDVAKLLKRMNFNDCVDKEMKKMDKLNIINIGKTGVGKSTIINAVFGQELARTGIGAPVTEHCDSYRIDGSPITIYDSKGLETGNSAGVLAEIYEVIERQNRRSNTKEYIHICWYCVLDDGNRLDENEVRIINDIRRIIPVIIVLTQSAKGEKTQTFMTQIRQCFLSNPIDIVPIMAVPKVVQSDVSDVNIRAHGLDALVNRSYDLLPESVAKTFAAFQNVNIELKVEHAQKATLAYSGAVAAAAIIPLPIADSIIMTAIQISMMAHITVCFGVSSRLNYKNIIAGLGGPLAGAFIGTNIASWLKAIPGVGTLTGMVIGASVGAPITYALGTVYTRALAYLSKNGGKINEAAIIDALKEAAKNINMAEIKKEWEKNKNRCSEAESEDILREAKSADSPLRVFWPDRKKP